MHMPLARGRLLPALAMLALHAAFLLAWLVAQRPTTPAGATAYILATMVPTPRLEATPKPALRPRAQQPRSAAAPQQPAPAPAVLVPDAKPEADPLVEAAPAGLLEQARRAAGPADLALRDGKPLPPLVRGDTQWARFEHALEGAHVGGARTVIMDRYVAADGVAITRVTIGSGVRCYMSGTIGARNGILEDTSRPKGVSCPPGNAGWTRL
jgi:hypothetical protein